jgi:hypothetical protein
VLRVVTAGLVWVPVSASSSWRSSPADDPRPSLMPPPQAYRRRGRRVPARHLAAGAGEVPCVACGHLPGQVWLTQQSSGPPGRQEQAGDLEHAPGWQARQIPCSRAARAATWPARPGAHIGGTARPTRRTPVTFRDKTGDAAAMMQPQGPNWLLPRALARHGDLASGRPEDHPADGTMRCWVGSSSAALACSSLAG